MGYKKFSKKKKFTRRKRRGGFRKKNKRMYKRSKYDGTYSASCTCSFEMPVSATAGNADYYIDWGTLTAATAGIISLWDCPEYVALIQSYQNYRICGVKTLVKFPTQTAIVSAAAAAATVVYQLKEYKRASFINADLTTIPASGAFSEA